MQLIRSILLSTDRAADHMPSFGRDLHLLAEGRAVVRLAAAGWALRDVISAGAFARSNEHAACDASPRK
jgi:hypothetical protein